MYVSALNPVPEVTPPAPLRFVGVWELPVAVVVQSVIGRCPPLLLVTAFTRVSEGAMSSLVIVQVLVWPIAIVPLQSAPRVLV